MRYFQDKFSGKMISNVIEREGYLLFYNGTDKTLHKYSMFQMNDVKTVDIDFNRPSRIEVDQLERVWMVSKSELIVFNNDLVNIHSFALPDSYNYIKLCKMLKESVYMLIGNKTNLYVIDTSK